ncbi:general substrate transporter [Melanogaster broomeanus]|nr:general substrate transporter [Melanogaster broomeanus]
MLFDHGAHAFTHYGWFVCLWVLTVSFQYGYHTSALNQLQAVITCQHPSTAVPQHYGLPHAYPLTSLFTVGGLFGSLFANLAMDRYGRKGATRLSAVFNAAGSAMSGVAASVAPIALGRFLVGVAAGIGICVGPIYLSEIAPAKIKGSLGVLTQLAIVIGIMVTQGMGFGLATPTQWRLVLFISFALSAIQYFVSPMIAESPAYLSRKGHKDEQEYVVRRLWGEQAGSTGRGREEGSDERLLTPENEFNEIPGSGQRAAITIPELLASPDLRRPLLTMVFAMSSQQTSESLISRRILVLYYSNNILSKSLPNFAPYVSLGITVVNFLMTFPPIFLIERVGRKKLIQWSVAGALVSHLAVGYGLNSGWVTLSSIAITTFVMSFAIGLGPIPFVIIPEVAPFHAVSAISSIALSLNWTVNFLVGVVFLQLRNFLAHGDSMKEGRVFYVFAAVLFCSALSFLRLYRG